jgi:hypothetical protein
MTSDKYIPVGRTSLVRRGDSPPLQIQTEYSSNPYARIATTVSEAGRVIHKIEKKLKHTVATFEEQLHLERVMQQQHLEVERIVEAQPPEEPSAPEPTASLLVVSEAEPDPDPERDTALKSLMIGVPPPEDRARQVADLLRTIPGVEYVFHLDALGNFRSRHAETQFKKAYAKVFKNLSELLDIFGLLDSYKPRREQGTVEIQRDRLYYASAGEDCYFVAVKRVSRETDFEKSIKAVVCPD